MEKQKKTNFGVGPWMLGKGVIDQFSAVTTSNVGNAIIIGRILYIIEKVGHQYMFRGSMSVDPVFDQGWWQYPFKPWQKKEGGHFKVYMNSNMDFAETKRINRILINGYIEKNQLYIKTTDPILTYFKTQK